MQATIAGRPYINRRTKRCYFLSVSLFPFLETIFLPSYHLPKTLSRSYHVLFPFLEKARFPRNTSLIRDLVSRSSSALPEHRDPKPHQSARVQQSTVVWTVMFLQQQNSWNGNKHYRRPAGFCNRLFSFLLLERGKFLLLHACPWSHCNKLPLFLHWRAVQGEYHRRNFSCERLPELLCSQRRECRPSKHFRDCDYDWLVWRAIIVEGTCVNNI